MEPLCFRLEQQGKIVVVGDVDVGQFLTIRRQRADSLSSYLLDCL